MATSAFKSTSKRGNLNSSAPLRNRDSLDSTREKTAPAPSTARKRSLSVSAVSRAKPSLDISTDFSNKRENPLFWASLSSPTDNGSNEISAAAETAREGKRWERLAVESTTKKGSAKTAATETNQRGRSVTRNSGVNNGIGRSISRVNRRSVSRGHYNASESESEQEVATFTGSRNSDLKRVIYNVENDNMVRNSADIQRCTRNSKTLNSQCETTDCSEDDSACGFQISNWEDGMSFCSLSEAEEKTVKAVCEQMKPFQNDQQGADGSASVIYETVRSEVRRAISDIQNDLESAIRRNNVNATGTSSIADIPCNLVDAGAIEFMIDIKRECTRKLEESEERAGKLRADLAVEEHRAKELSRILQEILPDPKTSNPQKSRMGRKRSTERKKISRRLTEEAMAYFDECVSLSTLDSSDFSAPEDPPLCSVGSMSVPEQILGHNLKLEALDNYSNNKQAVLRGLDEDRNSCEDSNLTANGGSSVPTIDQVGLKANSSGSSQLHQFSFAQKLEENFESDDFKSYIKEFEREGVVGNMVISDGKRSGSDSVEHDYSGVQSLLFERVFSRNRIESGGMHLCPGNFMVSFSLFGSVL